MPEFISCIPTTENIAIAAWIIVMSVVIGQNLYQRADGHAKPADAEAVPG